MIKTEVFRITPSTYMDFLLFFSLYRLAAGDSDVLCVYMQLSFTFKIDASDGDSSSRVCGREGAAFRGYRL